MAVRKNERGGRYWTRTLAWDDAGSLSVSRGNHRRLQGGDIDVQNSLAANIVGMVKHRLPVPGCDLAVAKADKTFYTTSGTDRDATMGCRVFDLGEELWRVDFPRAVFFVVEDMTDCKQRDERQEMPVAELNGRVRNALAVVHALLKHAVRRAKSLVQLNEVLSGRLQALGRGHEIPARSDWKLSDFAQFIGDAWRPNGYAAHILIDCDPIRARPQAAPSFNLILHELATHAAKFGALSVPDGRVNAERSSRTRRHGIHGFQSGRA